MLLIKIFSLSAVYGSLWETISQSYKGRILTGLWKALPNSKWVIMSIHVLKKKNWRVNDHIVKGLFFHKISLPVWNIFILIWCTTARCLHFLASFGQFFNKVRKTTQHKIKQSKSSCIFLKISKFNPQTSKTWFEIFHLTSLLFHQITSPCWYICHFDYLLFDNIFMWCCMGISY